MIASSILKNCQACGKPVKGRSDKKFCDDYCRNNYNNSLKSEQNNLVRNINSVLRKNRRILEDLLSPKKDICKVRKEKLYHLGFQFNYHTHNYTNKKGSTYIFCYEYGYLPLEQDWLLIVRRKPDHSFDRFLGNG